MKTITFKAPKGFMINTTMREKVKSLLFVEDLPAEWRLLPEKQYFYIDGSSVIASYDVGEDNTQDDDLQNVLPTKGLAIAMLSLIKLITMREWYRKGWIPVDNESYCITNVPGSSPIIISGHGVLSFETYELTKLFYERFINDIKIVYAKGLI